jgi:hypothetical protein
MVELVGIEPTTSSLRTMQSPVDQDHVCNSLQRSHAQLEQFIGTYLERAEAKVVRLRIPASSNMQ